MVREFDNLAERQILIARNTESAETTTKKLATDRFINERRSSRSGLVVGDNALERLDKSLLTFLLES